jgi:hypothetical protein
VVRRQHSGEDCGRVLTYRDKWTKAAEIFLELHSSSHAGEVPDEDRLVVGISRLGRRAGPEPALPGRLEGAIGELLCASHQGIMVLSLLRVSELEVGGSERIERDVPVWRSSGGDANATTSYPAVRAMAPIVPKDSATT